MTLFLRLKASLGPLGRFAERRRVRQSGLFDPEFYRFDNLDLRRGRSLLDHYVAEGWRQGRRPSAEFDLESYFRLNPDLAKAAKEPVRHYLEWGQREKRPLGPRTLGSSERQSALRRLRDSTLFDEQFYLDQVPQLIGAGLDPMLHYLLSGYQDHLEPSPARSMQAYVAANPALRRFNQNPLLHYVDHGKPEGFAAGRDGSSEPWTYDPEDRVLPDAGIGRERMAGQAFLVRFRGSKMVAGGLPHAIRILQASQPKLTVDKSAPQVAIIVPVVGPDHFLLSCLDSLLSQVSRNRVEIILVGRPQSTEVTRFIDSLSWVDRCDTPADTWRNLAEIGLQNARAEHVLLLSSTMRLVLGSIDILIDTLAPGIGFVVPQRLDSQWVERRALGLPFKPQRDDPNHPDQRYMRKLEPSDLESALSQETLLLRRDALTDFSGLAKSSGKIGATDAAIRARHDIVYQPFARVIDYDPVHAPLERMRFGPRALREAVSGKTFSFPVHPTRKPRLLVLDSFTPKPDQDSGSFITAKMLRAFQQLGFEVTFMPQDTDRFEGEYTEILQKAGIRCLYAPFVTSVDDLIDQEAAFDVVLAYRYGVMSRVARTIREKLPKARLIFHNVDLHYLREEREAMVKMDRTARLAAALTQTRELEMIAEADCTIVHTANEKALIEAQVPGDTVLEFPYVIDVIGTKAEFDDRRDIMFLGGFAHVPNVDAVKFLVRDVWPLIAPHLDDEAKLLIVGAAPTADINALASDRVIVTGRVPELAPWFDRARVFVAPLRFGAGIKGKVIQSLAHGLPSVATTIAGEGIGLTDQLDVLIADDARSIADAVVNLYHDKMLWSSMQLAGLSFVETRYSWQRCLELCARSLDIAEKTWLGREEELRKRLIAQTLARRSGSLETVPLPNAGSRQGGC